ncbi:serine/arginine-rich splicing factor SR45-like isoform X2 [Amphibalanus amphitrite]|uniref:serine/arginine-rich splicing factor SR45-like isoform X2 n=1 Tax=Amphibalanus amphitrite TaxID=1232801 RepID=UPI001C90FB41|nr:serine/arginine-rich splicing factor SR45-like isoform X2 [Amphibalanus amphitrite]XP_043246328.1 serine/arginine-rich splicing factor SR45-like isoform X2 [Amphibalanus amphitrite]
MSGGESAVLRSAKPHVGKENSMLPPLTSPSRVLSLSRGQKFASPKAGPVRRPNSEQDAKVHRATSPITNASPEKTAPNQQRRIQQLEKSILFMREHHEKIVSALHEEIEELKRKNKELNYRLVMSPASLPAHLLSPEEDQPPASSPRHQPSRAPSAAGSGHPVQLELLEGELNELRETLRVERERGDRLAAHLRQAEAAGREVPSSPASSPADVTALEQRLTAAEDTIRQLRKERDDCQREIQRMRGSVQFRPPWRAGGQPVRPPPPPQTSRSTTKAAGAAAAQQQLPRLPAANGNGTARQDAARSSTAPGRAADSRTPSQGSLPALPRSRGRQNQPPPPPPPRHGKPSQ